MTLETTVKFRKDVKRAIRRGLDLALLDEVIQTLLEEKQLDPKYNDHALHGDYTGFHECHIQSDWLLIYAVDKKKLILTASRTGSHADLL